MKKLPILIIIGLGICASALSANEVVYTEGDVTRKNIDDDWREMEIGDFVQNGDTIITDYNGYAEIETAHSLLRINPDTVFTFSEVEIEGQKRSALTCIAGSVRFKIETLLGPGPYINTMSSNAGVRGTEFTLFAATDGTSLITVSEGIVMVSSEKGSVELRAEEGVEVRPGQAPGIKFPVLRGQLDFKEWNTRQLTSFREDPIPSVYRLYSRLETFASQISTYDSILTINKEKLAYYRRNLEDLKTAGDLEAAREYYSAEILPVEVETSNLVMNMRYYSLSALSLRRYLLSRLYLTMKLAYPGNYTDQTYIDYLDAHKRTLDFYEQKIVPFLVDADI